MKITTSEQFRLLVSELEKNVHLSKGLRRGMSSVEFKKDWRRIAAKVNAIGPPSRDADGWHKVWKDLKFKVKKKLLQKKSELNAKNDEDSFRQMNLTPIEYSVVNLLQPTKRISYEEEMLEIKNEPVDSADEQIGMLDEISAIEIPSSTATPIALPRKRSDEVDKSKLLKRQVEVQENYYKETTKTLKIIECHLKESAIRQRKTYDLQQKRFQIYKRMAEKKEELLDLEIKFKKMDYEMKKREFEFMKSIKPDPDL